MLNAGPKTYVKVGFYLPRVLVDRLRAIARDEGAPASRIVSRLILEYIETHQPPPNARCTNMSEGDDTFDDGERDRETAEQIHRPQS
ncbi:MAG: hypothetical protein JO219_09705 [Candidatus Eremiobacteraeota bacterium]|nr:hypothetical protein [Candidatus Eremiobacteraeota bacterium]